MLICAEGLTLKNTVYADCFVWLQLKLNYIGNSRGQFQEKGEYSVLDKPLYISLVMM